MRQAFVFPGQGAQAVGMGAELAQHSPAARAVYTLADQALGWSVSELCFAGPEDQLTATENTQPALVATSLAVLAALAGDLDQIVSYTRQHAVAVAGHSLGEYSALVAAGSLTPTAAIQLVRQRGVLMAAATSGGMAAVIGLDDERIDHICRSVSTPDAAVVVANYNSPGQTVISGAVSALEAAGEALKAAGAKRVIPLKVSAAFHSPLMHDAAQALAAHVARTTIMAPVIPVISNITAQPLTTPAAIASELPAQVESAVRWVSTIQYLVADGVTHFVEIGAGNVLSGLIKRIAPDAVTTTITDVASLNAYRAQFSN
jgi:[acyl-carrier-protein] S-malonyltransferase